MASMFLLSCFLKHLMTKPRIEVKSSFAFWVVVGLRLYFKFLPQPECMIPISEKGLQSGH